MSRCLLSPIFLMSLALAGCVQYEEHVSLLPDGSGTIRVVLSGPASLSLGDDHPFAPETPEELAAELTKRYIREGVRLIEHDVREHDGVKTLDFTLEFRQLTDLNRANPYFGKWRFTTERRGAALHVERDLDWDSSAWNETESGFERWVKEELADRLLNKIRLRFEFTFPERVTETNAEWVRMGKTAVWSYRLSDLLGCGTTRLMATGQ
ncbi:MAG: hypothetical protein ONB23_10515 [candidate division KSB1 bacterium]|nr:hypothetical protein [candidate division KSB1 bacterium]